MHLMIAGEPHNHSLELYQRGSTLLRLRRLVAKQDLQLRHLRKTAADVEEQVAELENLQQHLGVRGSKRSNAIVVRQGVDLRRVRKTTADVEKLIKAFEHEQQPRLRLPGAAALERRRSMELLSTPWLSDSMCPSL